MSEKRNTNLLPLKNLEAFTFVFITTWLKNTDLSFNTSIYVILFSYNNSELDTRKRILKEGKKGKTHT